MGGLFNSTSLKFNRNYIPYGHSIKKRIFPGFKAITTISVTSAVAWLYWELFHRKPFQNKIKKNEKNFSGDTPFYGKLWGYSTDYLIQQSLQEGDLLFISYNTKGLHLHQVILKKLMNYISGTNFDEIGIVHFISGICHIISLDPFKGVQIETYPNKLAFSNSSVISTRRLQHTPSLIREKIKERINKIVLYNKICKPQIFSFFWWNFNRFRTHSKYFTNTQFFIEMEWQIRAHKTIIYRLKEIYEQVFNKPLDIDQIFLFKFLDTDSKSNIKANDIIDRNTKYNTEESIIQIICDLKKKIEDFEQEIQKRKNNDKFPGLSEELVQQSQINSFLRKILEYFNSFFIKSSILGGTTSAFVANIYKEVGLLPDYVPPQAWTTFDFSTIDALSNTDSPINLESKSYSVLPFLSNHFYIRQDISEQHHINRLNPSKIKN